MKGILFRPELIKAIVDGRKIETRRVIIPQPIETVSELKEHSQLKGYWIPYSVDKRMVNNNPGSRKNDCGYVPKYQVGEVVYIKEAHRYIQNDGDPYDFGIQYLDSQVKWWRDNGNLMDYPIDEKWRSPLFLKEIFARYFIQIAGVKAERVQEITPMDCIKEGIEPLYEPGVNGLILRYAILWNSINKGYPFESNPYIFRYEFALVTVGATQ